MSPSELRWTPFFTLLHREVSRFLKVAVQTVITPLINSFLYLLIFGVSLGKSISIGHGLPYLAFLIPGLVMMACLNNSFQNSSSSIIGSKFGGDLEDLRVSPLSNFQIIWAYSIGGFIRGIMVGSITFLVGEVFFHFSHGGWLMIQHPWLLAVFLIIGSLSFAQLGISVAFWAKNFDQLSAVSGFILLPLIYLGGVFFSLKSLAPFWQTLSRFNPLLYFINGVRYGILGFCDVAIGEALVISFLSLALTYFLALISLNKGSFLRW